MNEMIELAELIDEHNKLDWVITQCDQLNKIVAPEMRDSLEMMQLRLNLTVFIARFQGNMH